MSRTGRPFSSNSLDCGYLSLRVPSCVCGYVRLDRALADVERTRDRLEESNQELARTNARVRAIEIAHAELLNLADERTQGRMRELIGG
jgi:hypothetical protein